MACADFIYICWILSIIRHANGLYPFAIWIASTGYYPCIVSSKHLSRPDIQAAFIQRIIEETAGFYLDILSIYPGYNPKFNVQPAVYRFFWITSVYILD